MTKRLLLLLVGTLAAVALAQNDEGRVVPQNSDGGIAPIPPQPPSHTNTTTAPPTKPTTVTTPTTTTKATTTSATPTSTTTKSPPTTSKTTASPTTPSTTAKPTQKPTPAPAPKPDEPVVGSWQVNCTNSSNICLMVQFALQIDVPYISTFNKSQSAYIDVPKNANVTGDLKNETQTITLQWGEDVKAVNNITFNFAMDNTTKKYMLDDIEVCITPTNVTFPDFNDTNVLHLNHKYSEFRTTVSKSYKCVKKQELNLTDDVTHKPRGTIYVSHLQFEAFRNSTNKGFSSAEDCAPFDTPDVVPIAVGCALAALVIVVLIAYLIGRRRRQARGYLSM